jgi:hypothetical protein
LSQDTPCSIFGRGKLTDEGSDADELLPGRDSKEASTTHRQ